MNPKEQRRFDHLYELMVRDLILQGLRPKTVEAYSRALRRVAGFFDRCPYNLESEELKAYFASLVKSHSGNQKRNLQYLQALRLTAPVPSTTG